LSVERRLLRQIANRDALTRKGFAAEVRVETGHDFEQRRLAGAIRAENANLRAGEKRKPDVLENDGIGRMCLPEPLHSEDVLRRHKPRTLSR
jgi:hypothetical protein